MFKAQQDILNKRKQGTSMEGVSERRAKAKQADEDRDQKKKRDRARLARGEALDNDDDGTKPYGTDDEGMKGGIIIPLAPFGIPKYDRGERFDLKAPYTDEGWVDEYDQGPVARLAEIFSGGRYKSKKQLAAEERRKGAQAAQREREAAEEAAAAAKQGEKKWPWQR